MAWRAFERFGRRGALSLSVAAVWVAGCGDGGTGPGTFDDGQYGAFQVSAASPTGWTFAEELPVGVGGYVVGPGTAPMGFGSAKLYVDGTGRLLLGTLAYKGLPLKEITFLEYYTYTQPGSSPSLAVTLQLDIDYDLSDANTAWQGRLVFEPYFTSSVIQGIWQAWTPLTGMWWASAEPGKSKCSQTAPCTWAQVRAEFPNAGIRVGNGVLQFKAGGPWASFIGYVDRLTVTTVSATATYDFEPSLEPCEIASEERGHRIRLTADCVTEETLFIPNGWTLDGGGFTITARDPPSGPFLGAVLQNGGPRAHVRNVRITANVMGGCQSGPADTTVASITDTRIAGIRFYNGSGSVMFTTVENIRRAGSFGCQEGNGIEARNWAYWYTGRIAEVTFDRNTVVGYQKTGILADRFVRASITSNDVSSANLDNYIAANSIQISRAATATVQRNRVQGNDWDGPTNEEATAILLYIAGHVQVTNNDIGGATPRPWDRQTDIGIASVLSGVVNVMNNYIGRHVENEITKPCATSPFRPGATPAQKCDDDGIGVYFDDAEQASRVVNNRFSENWNQLVVGADLDRHNRTLSPIP